jgi:AraC-like DNA-binding protein
VTATTDTGSIGGLAPLQAALEQLRLDGAIFFRAEFTERWAYESPPAELAGMLRPGAERLIFFHIVAAGRCWIALEGGERLWASRGDVIVLPYGDQHHVGGADPAELVPIVTLLAPPPWETMPVLRYGAGGDRTDIVCGYLHSEDPLFNPALRALPQVFVVRPPAGPAAQFVEASIAWALANTSEYVPAEPVSTRLPELLLIEVLRLHLATAPAVDHGWIAALRDPVLAPAMAEMHAAPEMKWTVADLAASAAVSRSVLDERFRQVLGRSPIRYLTEWRMHIAEDLLATTDHGVATVARRVGYDSEEAFSRAFKRSQGTSPGAWRTERRNANRR